MNFLLIHIIYVIGFSISLIYGIKILNKNNKSIPADEFFILLFLSLFSWLAFFALWIGQKIKNNNDDNINPSGAF